MGRKTAVVNLDPANDETPYTSDIDISDLINHSEVMDMLKLGPNGALLYCMEYLEQNLDWLRQRLTPLKDHYILFDCPGQVELYTHHNSVKSIFSELTKMNYRLAAVHLVDSHYCSDPSKFISVLLTSLSTMLQIELPHVNILSKADLIEKHGKLAFNLDFYTEVLDLGYLLDHFSTEPFFKKYKKLNEVLVDIVQDYSLVNFVLLNIEDKETMLRVIKSIDKSNGYVFGHKEESQTLQSLMSCAVGAEFECEKISNIQEKYVNEQSDEDDMAEFVEKQLQS